MQVRFAPFAECLKMSSIESLKSNSKQNLYPYMYP